MGLDSECSYRKDRSAGHFLGQVLSIRDGSLLGSGMRKHSIFLYSIIVQRIGKFEFFAIFLISGCLLQRNW